MKRKTALLTALRLMSASRLTMSDSTLQSWKQLPFTLASPPCQGLTSFFLFTLVLFFSSFLP